ncbi:hypothetical protein EX895_004727 [Sporisorium graminicola]|uniref:BZIP domain-containing protein n=1 Tax=Sporisorium graminicola TaxID=280036 RepID=A0A4U7KTH9_9BASI|nr:hypothetical protein EX895_004727 [Sporisorium graminicola]TKY86578.1 hypothetical protein EX895_004727 [Sporisorium graminicola]
MRSSATVGLTPQQLLDRRRAQNKLAQRRFREKARMARSTGLDVSSSDVPAFPSHLDLTRATSMPSRKPGMAPRVRSSSSDSTASSSSSSSSSSSAASVSSQVSSPTSSSCTELNTPTIPHFYDMQPPKPMAVADMPSTSAGFLALDIKSDLTVPETCLYLPPPPAPTTFVAPSYASLNAVFPQPLPLLPPTSSEPLTYSSLAAASNHNIGLKMIGIHADPFLMSQPLPSPSLPLWPSGLHSIFPGPAPELTPIAAQHSQPLASASFETLLRMPAEPSSTSSSASEDFSVSEPCFSPLSAAKSLPESGAMSLPLLVDKLQTMDSDTEAGRCASMHLDKAISDHAQRVESGVAHATAQTLSIASQSFASAVEQIGARFGLCSHNGDRLAALLSRLQLYGKLNADGESSKGLVFDAAIDWDAMGSNMLPTTEQLVYPHRAFLDACLPWPAVRSRLLKHSLTHPVCEEEFALDLLLSVLSSDEALASFRVHGDDVLDPEAWELSERMVTKWWGLFDETVLRRTNWWRRQRGLEQLAFPADAADDNACEPERQGLGTGSLDQVHRLAASLFH